MPFSKKISALEQAFNAGNLENIEAAIQQGANLEEPFSSGKPPLFHAVDSGRIDILQLLLKMKVNVERRDRQNQTPLYAATRSGHIDAVKALLIAKANPNVACGPQGQTPLFAVMEGYDGRLFLDATILRATVPLLLDNGADPQCRTSTGLTLLHGAACCDDLETLNLLLSNGLDPNVSAGATPPILISVRKGKAEIVSRFIEAGANIGVRFPNAMTLMDFANRRGDRQVIEALRGPTTLAHPGPPAQDRGTQQSRDGPTTTGPQPRKRSGGDWNLLLLSSIIVGIAAHFAIVQMGPPGVAVVAVIYYFCIINRNFGFNLLQKALGTSFAYAIAFFWPQIITLFKGH